MNQAVLLIGPTGAGKTPLGQALQDKGLGPRTCHHLDFGQLLRRAAAGAGPHTLDDGDLACIRDVLDRGALLENEHFHVAAKLVDALLGQREVRPDDIVVLNGLPRHVAQARDVDAMFHVVLVVDLACPEETVLRRIGTNAGGDRAARADDDRPAVRDRLALFAARTRPLIDHYRQVGARIVTIPIGPTTTAEEAREALGRML